MPHLGSDLLSAEALSPLDGSPLVYLLPGAPLEPGAVAVLVDRAGQVPDIDPAGYDALVTTNPNAPRPWVHVPPARLDAQLAAAALIATQAPIATALLAKLLRLGEGLAFDTALELESLAYSTLLGGDEFGRWLAGSGHNQVGEQSRTPVRYERDGRRVTVTLASPANHNAMTAPMRDALYETLVNVLEDPSEPHLVLQAEGKCFSTGGSLHEFGTARDLARAHVVRTQHNCGRILHRIGTRAEVRLHGACIGSGIEIPAAAGHRIAAPDLIVQLPELRMGLIPGAGGTATLGRTIGRHRLCWLALGAFRIGARQALDWGLIHAIEA